LMHENGYFSHHRIPAHDAVFCDRGLAEKHNLYKRKMELCLLPGGVFMLTYRKLDQMNKYRHVKERAGRQDAAIQNIGLYLKGHPHSWSVDVSQNNPYYLMREESTSIARARRHMKKSSDEEEDYSSPLVIQVSL
jgi:hypothetical protein